MNEYELAKRYHRFEVRRWKGFVLNPEREAELIKNIPEEVKDQLESFSVMTSLYNFHTFTSYKRITSYEGITNYEDIRYHFILLKDGRLYESFTCVVEFYDEEIMNIQNLLWVIDDIREDFLWYCHNMADIKEC